MPVPATTAASSAQAILPVASSAAKAANAPITIMPSTPRLSTPARSATSSPVAASTSGVAAISTLTRMLLTRSKVVSLGCWRRCDGDRARRRLPVPAFGRGARGPPARPIVDRDVGRQHEKQQHALERADAGAGKAHADLRHLAADAGERQQQAGGHNAERIEAA